MGTSSFHLPHPFTRERESFPTKHGPRSPLTLPLILRRSRSPPKFPEYRSVVAVTSCRIEPLAVHGTFLCPPRSHSRQSSRAFLPRRSTICQGCDPPSTSQPCPALADARGTYLPRTCRRNACAEDAPQAAFGEAFRSCFSPAPRPHPVPSSVSNTTKALSTHFRSPAPDLHNVLTAATLPCIFSLHARRVQACARAAFRGICAVASSARPFHPCHLQALLHDPNHLSNCIHSCCHQVVCA